MESNLYRRTQECLAQQEAEREAKIAAEAEEMIKESSEAIEEASSQGKCFAHLDRYSDGIEAQEQDATALMQAAVQLRDQGFRAEYNGLGTVDGAMRIYSHNVQIYW